MTMRHGQLADGTAVDVEMVDLGLDPVRGEYATRFTWSGGEYTSHVSKLRVDNDPVFRAREDAFGLSNVGVELTD